MRVRSAFLGLLVLASLAPRPARAWSANGHRAVARLAAARLGDAARRAVADILGPGVALDAVAACADDIRGDKGYACAGIPLEAEPWSEPWHFVDAPVSSAPADGAALEAFCPGGACVMDQIRADVETLRDPAATRARKQVALMFLVHFAGDLHQPLHCAHEIVDGVGDRGGNLKPVVFEGAELNLHSLWDHQILAGDTNDAALASARLAKDLEGKDVSPWLAGDFVAAAAFESFSIAKSTIYPSYRASDPRSLGAEYRARMAPIVDERLERAGVRLAALLERALAPGASAAVVVDAAAAPRPRAAFAGVSAKMTLGEIFARLGPASADVGSGLHVYAWDCADGRRFLVGAPDADPASRPRYARWDAKRR